ILQEKDAEAILAVLEPLLDYVVITRTSSPRAIPADELADLARDVFDDEERVIDRSSLPDAIQAAVDLSEEGGGQFGGVVVAGSVRLAAEVRALLARTPVSAWSRPPPWCWRLAWCSSRSSPPASWFPTSARSAGPGAV